MTGGKICFFDTEGNVLTDYRKAPIEILYANNLKDFSKILYFEIYTLHISKNKKGVFFKTKTLAKRLNVSESYVTKSLTELEQNDYIIRRTSKFNTEIKAKRREIKVKPLKASTKGNEVAYCQFPAPILSLDIRLTSKLVLIELYHQRAIRQAIGDNFTVNRKTISDKLNKTPMTIYNAFKELSNHGLITTHTVKNKIYVEFEILLDELGI